MFSCQHGRSLRSRKLDITVGKKCHIAFKICYVPQKNHELSQTVGFMMFYAEITPQRQASTARNFWGCCTTSKCAATFSAQKCQTCRVSQVSPWSMVGIKCTNFLRFAQCCPVLHGVVHDVTASSFFRAMPSSFFRAMPLPMRWKCKRGTDTSMGICIIANAYCRHAMACTVLLWLE